MDTLRTNTIHTTELLAKYGFRIDSANDVIVRKLSDSALNKAVPALEILTGTFETINFNAPKVSIPLVFYTANNLSAYNVDLKAMFFFARADTITPLLGIKEGQLAMVSGNGSSLSVEFSAHTLQTATPYSLQLRLLMLIIMPLIKNL